MRQKDAVAQLIADSTEKKFKFNNIFKGMWKKKHYSFDLSWRLLLYNILKLNIGNNLENVKFEIAAFLKTPIYIWNSF